jgi:hypothetical protein
LDIFHNIQVKMNTTMPPFFPIGKEIRCEAGTSVSILQMWDRPIIVFSGPLTHPKSL